MLKLRLMGTREEMAWFQKFLKENNQVNVLRTSELYVNKGPDSHYRIYVEVEKET